MLISLTVNYVVETEEKDDFWESGRVSSRIQEALADRFPEDIALSAYVRGTRNSLTYLPMMEGQNCVRCECCGRFLSVSDTLYLGLDYCCEIDGKQYCPSCAWEVKGDLEMMREPSYSLHSNQ